MVHPSDYPFVSIIICSRFRHGLLEKAVASVKVSEYLTGRYEIIVVEEGDNPSPIEQVKYIFLPKCNLGLGYARKCGVGAAKGEFILFTDDDCTVEKDWVKKIIEPMLNDKEVYGVSGATLIKGNPIIGTCEAVFGFPGGGYKYYVKANGRIIDVPSASGCNMAYRASVFDFLQIDDKVTGRLGTDDSTLSQEVAQKWKLVFSPNAIVYHLPRNSFSGIYHLMHRRRHKEFLSAGSRINILKAIFNLRRGLIPRLLLAIAIVYITKKNGVLIVLLIMISFYSSFTIRFLQELKAAKGKMRSYFVLPLVKATMDISVLLTDIKYLFSGIWTANFFPDAKKIDKYYYRE